MTRADAFRIISDAVLTEPLCHGAAADPDFTTHLAVIVTALDALGLLTLATATSDSQERSSHEEIAATARIVSGNPLGWAATRTRD